MPKHSRHAPSSLPAPLRQWRDANPGSGCRAALARGLLLAISDAHGLAPGALADLFGAPDLQRCFWEPPGAAGALLSGLLTARAHGPPPDPPHEANLRSLLLALRANGTAAALAALRPEDLSGLFERVLGEGSAGRAGRRAAGIYYTPGHIVDYIVENTLGRLLQEADQPSLPRVLDPACGAGAFLVAAFRALATRSHEPAPLLGAIHGVDLDPHAVAAARLSLLLAARELRPGGADDGLLELVGRRVVWGNALISPSEDGARPDALAWDAAFPDALARGGFDAVVGNPPYLNLKRGTIAPEDKRHFAARFHAARGQYDAFGLFVERALDVLAPGGLQAFVVPRPLLSAESYAPVRRLLLRQQVEAVADAGAPFAGVAVEAAVVVVRKPPAASEPVRLERVRSGAPPALLGRASQRLFEALPAQPLSYRITERSAPLIDRLARYPTRLSDHTAHMSRGLELGKRSALLTDTPRPDAHPILRGEDVARYAIRPPALSYLGEGPRGKLDPTAHPERLLIRRVSTRLNAAIDRDDSWTLNTLYTLVPGPQSDAALLLGLLNARLLSFYLRVVYLSDDRLFPYLRLSQIAALPAPALLPATGEEAEQRREIAALAEELQALHTGLRRTDDQPERERLLGQIDARERRVDWLVYRLFGLSDDEAALVDAEPL